MNNYHLRQLGNTTALTPLSLCIETNATTCVNINYNTDYVKCLIVCHYRPPLFLRYINDKPLEAVKFCKVHHLADDTNHYA